MIHTLSYNWDNVEQGDYGIIDLSADLTRKLQQMVRQGSIFKVVGIDIASLPDASGTSNEGGAAGVLRFYGPTKGRCDAWRHAFAAVSKWRKIQGVAPNYNYDFRVGFDAGIPTIQEGGPLKYPYDSGANKYIPTPNQAWLEYYADDVSEATFQGLFLTNSGAAESQQSIFDVYNLGIEMNDGKDAPTFGQGWTPYSPFESADAKVDMDFVKNETALLVTNPNGPQYASLTRDEIGFQTSWSQDDDNGQSTVPFSFRPVSAEYMPILCGLIEMQVTDTINESDVQTLITTVYVSGWKPILQRRRRKGRKGKR